MMNKVTAPIEISSTEGIVAAREKARDLARELGFRVFDQTRIATAVSELARNIYQFAGEGHVILCEVQGSRRGLRIVFEDNGPGINDVEMALRNGYSTAGSLGLGLPGAKRLSDEFEIESELGKGTKITITKWL